jgi:hypothetical protein
MSENQRVKYENLLLEGVNIGKSAGLAKTVGDLIQVRDRYNLWLTSLKEFANQNRSIPEGLKISFFAHDEVMENTRNGGVGIDTGDEIFERNLIAIKAEVSNKLGLLRDIDEELLPVSDTSFDPDSGVLTLLGMKVDLKKGKDYSNQFMLVRTLWNKKGNWLDQMDIIEDWGEWENREEYAERFVEQTANNTNRKIATQTQVKDFIEIDKKEKRFRVNPLYS